MCVAVVTVGDVLDVHLDWTDIKDGKLTSASANLTISGNYSLVQGQVTTAIRLDTAFMEMTVKEDSCILNLALCKDTGFTLLMKYRFIELYDDMYFVSSGAEIANQQGVAFFYKYRKFHAIVALDYQMWMVSWEGLILNRWYEIDLSWISTSGLQVYVDGLLVAHAKQGTMGGYRSDVGDIVIVGRQYLEVNVHASVDIEGISTFTTTRQVLISNTIIDPGNIHTCYMKLLFL